MTTFLAIEFAHIFHHVLLKWSILYQSFCIHVLPGSVDETAFEPEVPDEPLDGGVVVVVVVVMGETVDGDEDVDCPESASITDEITCPICPSDSVEEGFEAGASLFKTMSVTVPRN